MMLVSPLLAGAPVIAVVLQVPRALAMALLERAAIATLLQVRAAIATALLERAATATLLQVPAAIATLLQVLGVPAVARLERPA